MTGQSTTKSASLVISANYFNKFSRDLYLPSLPALAIAFNTDEHTIKYAFSLYFLAVTLSRIIWPPLADIVRSRKILLITSVLFSFASLICLFAHAFWLFMLGRFLQGFTIGCIPAITRAVTFQHHGATRTLKILSFTSIIAVWSPAIATTLGGVMHQHYGWQANFFLLTIFSFVLFLFYIIYLPDSPSHEERFNLQKMRQMLGTAEVWHLILPYCLTSAATMVYFVMSSFILMNQFGLSADWFGLLFFIIIAGMLVGKLLAGLLIDYYDMPMIIKLGAFICLLATVLMGLFSYYPFHYLGAIGIISIYFLGNGLIIPASKTAVMAIFPASANTASAYLGIMAGLSITLATLIAAALPSNLWNLSLLLAGLTIPSVLAVMSAR